MISFPPACEAHAQTLVDRPEAEQIDQTYTHKHTYWLVRMCIRGRAARM